MITNKLNLPQPFVDAVTKEYQYKPKQYSVTSLLKGTMQVILERRHKDEVDVDVSDMVWAIFGSAVHKILEGGKETENQLKENWLAIDIGEYKLSGIFDLYDAEKKKVTDYKTGSLWKAQFNDWDDYRKQLLMYAYMLNQIGFECEYGEIVMLLKDHSKTTAKYNSNYPQHPVYIKTFKFFEKDFDEIEKFIYGKFASINSAEKLPDDKLPLCSEKDRWHESDAWAVMEKGKKRAKRVFHSETEAREMLEKDKSLYIEFREGADKRCEEYCSVKEFCWYYRKQHESNR